MTFIINPLFPQFIPDVQVYNYLEKTARVVFGPDLVVLNPHENFNVLSLSGTTKNNDYLLLHVLILCCGI